MRDRRLLLLAACVAVATCALVYAVGFGAPPINVPALPGTPVVATLASNPGPALFVVCADHRGNGTSVTRCAISPAGIQAGPALEVVADGGRLVASAALVASPGDGFLLALEEAEPLVTHLRLAHVGEDGASHSEYVRVEGLPGSRPPIGAGWARPGPNAPDPAHVPLAAVSMASAGGWTYLAGAPAQLSEASKVAVARCTDGQWSDWQWMADVGPDGGTAPSLASTAEGALYLLVTAAGSRACSPRQMVGSPVLCTSLDGATWSEPVPTVRDGKARMTALAADEEHGLVLVYTAEHRDGWPVFAARSMDNGETWGKPVMLTEPTVYAFRPDAMLHDGVLYVAYLGMPTPPPPAREGGNSRLPDPDGAYVLTVDPATLPVAEG